jgi:dihydropyrimidinase
VEVCCTNPAKIMGLPRKGQLLPGYDADVVIFDPHKNFTFSASALHSAIDYCTYDGITVAGYPRTTISRGEVIVEDGEFFGQPGRGRFIARGAV